MSVPSQASGGRQGGQARYPLAVFSPRIGARTETFIKRHVEDLLPGRTVVVVRQVMQEADWTIAGPMLDIGRGRRGIGARALRSVSRTLPAVVARRLDPIRRFLRRHEVEVLLGEYMHTSLPLLPLTRELGIRFFVHAHGHDVSEKLQAPSWRRSYLDYNSASGIITMSDASRRRLIDLGLQPERIRVIPYGVDVPCEAPRRHERETVQCMAVGRMVEKKAPILMLDAFRRAAAVVPNLRLEYVGAGELWPAVRQFIRAFGLEGKVTLHGEQPHGVVIDLMRRSDIFLQHSVTAAETGDEEGLPVGILEAMAQALPVVATRHAGIPEAVEDAVTGRLVDEGDTIGMAEIVVALARDPDLARRMGRNGWQRAGERYSWKRERSELLRALDLDTISPAVSAV